MCAQQKPVGTYGVAGLWAGRHKTDSGAPVSARPGMGTEGCSLFIYLLCLFGNGRIVDPHAMLTQ